MRNPRIESPVCGAIVVIDERNLATKLHGRSNVVDPASGTRLHFTRNFFPGECLSNVKF